MPRRRAEAESPAPAPPRKPAARRTAARAPRAPGSAELLSALSALVERLQDSLQEIPRPEDFQPLADHLYEFAQTAPRVVDHLTELPQVTEPFGRNVQALQEVTETLQGLHSAFSDSLFRLPRPEDYEPLAEPLRQFARTAPALVSSLGEVVQVGSPLASSVRDLGQIAERFERLHERVAERERPGADAALLAILQELGRQGPALGRSLATLESLLPSLTAPPPAPAPTPPPLPAPTADHTHELHELATFVEAARSSIVEALAQLPAEHDYAALAEGLRALAADSPALRSWLVSVSTVSQPLAGSVQMLREAASTLKAAHTNVLSLLSRPAPAREDAGAARRRGRRA